MVAFLLFEGINLFPFLVSLSCYVFFTLHNIQTCIMVVTSIQVQVSPCEIYEIFKNTYIEEHQRTNILLTV